MIATKLLAGAAAGLLLAAAAPTQQSAQPAPAAPPEKKICKSLQTVGTVIPKRICLTAAEWNEFSETTKRQANIMLNRRDSGSCEPKC